MAKHLFEMWDRGKMGRHGEEMGCMNQGRLRVMGERDARNVESTCGDLLIFIL